MCDRLSQLIIRLKIIVVELNIFKHLPSNDRQIRYQRCATRLYIALVACSFGILTFYILLIQKIHHSTILNPTVVQYLELEKTYPNNIFCPCSSISTSYSTFMTIYPHYHQLCSSDLVSKQWFNSLIWHGFTKLYFADYRMNGPSQFRILAAFCQQAEQTISNALRVFLQTQYVSSQVVSPQLFEFQAYSLIEAWRSMTINQSMYINQFVRAMIRGNQLLHSDSDIPLLGDLVSSKMTVKPLILENCSCVLSPLCLTHMSIYYPVEDTSIPIEIHRIPNFFVGCYFVEGLLASTLECYYNLSCVLELYHYIPYASFLNFSILDESRNQPNETIESIFNRLMVDSWSSNISFISFYNSCAPLSCTVEYRRRNDLFSVTTAITGVFGGLSLGLKFIILFVVRLIEKRIFDFPRLRSMHFIRHLCRCNTEHQMKRRLHFILTALTLYFLYVFSAFHPKLVTVEVKNVPFSVYEDLTERFSDSLYCPCSRISTKYESFLTVVPRFHGICASDFVSEKWIASLYGEREQVNQSDSTDFRQPATAQFQLLASLCHLSQQAVNISLSQVMTSDLTNIQLLSSSLLDERIQMILTQFQRTVSHLFPNILSLIRETTAANMLMTSLGTSWIFTWPPKAGDLFLIPTAPVVYGGCSCSSSSKCITPSRDMLVGCYPLEVILQTSLRCFYDQGCIDSTSTFKAMTMSSLSPSRFNTNSTIESIVDEVMIEEYSSNIDREKYFTKCAPSSCSYSYIDKTNFIEGMTTLISFYGGLFIINQFIAGVIIKLFRRQLLRIAPQID